MAQQSAVEWLVRKLSMELIGEIPLHRWDDIRDAVQHAKQMEKEQIVKAYVEGINLVPCDVNSTDELDAEKYYHKTFGNK